MLNEATTMTTLTDPAVSAEDITAQPVMMHDYVYPRDESPGIPPRTVGRVWGSSLSVVDEPVGTTGSAEGQSDADRGWKRSKTRGRKR